MDRQFVYSGAVPLDTDLLNTNRNVLIALGLLALDIFGGSTVAGGLPCTATSPASLNVLLGPGRIYSLEAVDSTAYSSLPADTVDDILKQGINLASTELSCPAPGTAGTSIDYLIEAIYADQDGGDTVLPYYNASNPGSPFSGPNGNGTAQPTVRSGVVSLKAKAGVAAATGTQTTPPVDSGWTALYIVTVAYGQTTITAANISVYPGAPFITGALLTEPIADQRYLQLSGGVLTGALTGTSAIFSSGIFTSLTVNGLSVQNAAMLTSGVLNASRLGINPNTARFLYTADGSTPQWTTIAFSDLVGAIANGQVPSGAVTQWQASLSISFSQLTGSIANAQVPVSAVTQWQGSLSIGFGQLTGSIANGQVPVGAVTQWQGNLSINGSQVSGVVPQASTITNNGAGAATFSWSGQAGQPSWLLGSNDGTHFFVWNPTNFSVNEVQGYAPTAGAVASSIVLRDGSGYIWGNYFNQASAQNENPTISQVMVTNASDNFLRKASIANFLEQAMLSGAVTLQADPGGTPANGTPGSIVAYF